MNKHILVGNLGKDPELRYTEGGTAKCTFPLATTETYKDKEGQIQKITDWHNVVIWRRLAEVAGANLKKGSKICTSGKVKTRSYQDQDGNTKYITEHVVDTLEFLSKKPAPSDNDVPPEKAHEPQQGAGDPSPNDWNTEEDDLPF